MRLNPEKEKDKDSLGLPNISDEQLKKLVEEGGWEMDLEFDPETGQVAYEIHGVKGKACDSLAKFQRDTFGTLKESEATAEFDQEPVKQIKEEIKEKLTMPTQMPGIVSSFEPTISPKLGQKQQEKEKGKEKRFRSNPCDVCVCYSDVSTPASYELDKLNLCEPHFEQAVEVKEIDPESYQEGRSEALRARRR